MTENVIGKSGSNKHIIALQCGTDTISLGTN